MEMDAAEIIAIYRKRWEIELLFKQLKQNFPLRYFYGESANAIKIQVWVTLIANLLLMVLQKRIKRPWSFSGLATLVRIMLMYYVNCYTFFENPEKDWAKILEEAKEQPPELSLFRLTGLGCSKRTFATPVCRRCRHGFYRLISFSGHQ